MRRNRYLEKCAAYIPAMQRVAGKRGLDSDAVDDVVSRVLDDVQRLKCYNKFSADSLRLNLMQRTRWAAQTYKRNELNRSKYVARMPEGDDALKIVNIRTVETNNDCPFCFEHKLNQYGACMHCHTIIPRELRGTKRILSLEEVSVEVDYEYHKQADVRKAVASLSPLEQRVIIACIMGNESLESFAALENTNKSALWRVWVTAKEKLRIALKAYADHGKRCAKHDLGQFQRALNAAP